MSNECVILWRNTQNGKVGYIADGDSDRIMVYANYRQALHDIPNIPVLQAGFPYQIVELENL